MARAKQFFAQRRWPLVIRATSLILFLILAILDLERFWLPVLLTALLSAWLPKRWYCAWVCPVTGCNACWRRFVPKRFIQTPKLRLKAYPLLNGIWLALLAAIFLLCLILEKRIKLFVLITLLGSLISILGAKTNWCAHWCPWGQIMKAVGWLAGRVLQKKPY